MDLTEQQVERKVSVSHGHDGINRIGVAATDQIAQLLIHDVNGLAPVVFGREFFQFLGDQVANTTQLLVTEGIGGFALEYHFPP